MYLCKSIIKINGGGWGDILLTPLNCRMHMTYYHETAWHANTFKATQFNEKQLVIFASKSTKKYFVLTFYVYKKEHELPVGAASQ